MSWIISVLEMAGGVMLLTLAVLRRWVNWLSAKGSFAYWIVQYLMLFFAVWAIFKGLLNLLDLARR